MDALILSKIAHELRTPLTLIHSTLQLIEAQLPQMKDLKYWSQLNEDFRDINELITSLTTFQENTVKQAERTDLYQMLGHLQENFLRDPIGKTASLTLTATEEARKAAEDFPCSRVQMKQVFINLIKNALEATEKQELREIRTDLSTRHVPLSDKTSVLHFLCIAVRDNGPGIPQDILPHLYTPFVSGKQDGTGIGLSIARNIIQEHDGHLEVESSSSGTTFLVYLPYIL